MRRAAITYASVGTTTLTLIDSAVDWIVAAGATLALPLSLLLFLQWPLRDVVQVGSREANDLGQLLFALYVSIGISAATRQRAHLAVDIVARRYPDRVRRTLAAAGAILVLVPWGCFVLYAAGPDILHSVRQLERFPDTFNPGYFILKIAVGMLALLALVQALLTVFHAHKAAP